VVGTTGSGRLQVIPITGGTICGETIKRKWCSGGADWNVTHQDGIAHMFVRYLLETDDGEFVAIKNEGLIEPVSETVIKTKSFLVQTTLGNIVILTTVPM
jgi:hypothetical protein